MHFSYHREKKKSRDLSVSDILSPGRWSITDQKSWIGTCDNIKKVEQNNNVIKWNEMTGPYVSHSPRARLLALLPAWASSHFPDLRPGIGFSSDPPIISFCSEGGGDRFDHSKSMPRTCPVWAPRNLELLGPSFQGLSPRDSTRRCQCLGASLCTPFSPLPTHHGVTRDRNVLCW